MAPFDGLTLRPPTPLRDTADTIVAEACDFLSDSFEVEDATATARPPQQTGPVLTPLKNALPSVDSAAANSGRTKKVDFSPFTDYHRPDDLVSRPGARSSPLRPLPQPKDHKTLRSILKSRLAPTVAPESPSPNQSAPKFNTFADMLDSLVKQLASRSNSHRQDAYITLLSTLKEYDNTPDTQSLVEKIGLLLDFIKRDTALPIASGGVILAQQALKLQCALVNLAPVARHIPVEFQKAFVNSAVQVFGDESVPKKIVNPFLGAYALQNFGPKIIDQVLADKIVTSVQTIDKRISGKSVLASRCAVYQKLLVQSPDVMISRANDWLPHFLDGMVCTTPKELRRKAIEAGNSAAIRIGDRPKISRLVAEILDSRSDNGKFSGRDYVKLLENMLKDANSISDVPKVWAIIVLFLRGQYRGSHDWVLPKELVMIIQYCFNSSNTEVVVNANAAWNRFVYAVRPDTTTSIKTRNFLRLGIVQQMDRKAGSMESAFSSYCTLLYYSLPPTASEEQLDLYWEEYVEQVLLDKMIKKHRNRANRACQILADLFKGNKTGIWNENLALEIGRVAPSHLPGLDSKWVRRRLGVILKLVQPCLSSAFWDVTPVVPPAENQTSADSSVCSMWLALMSTVAEAGSKEVTTSMEFKAASANLMNFLHRVWNGFPASLGSPDDEEGIRRFSFLVISAAQTLGPFPFSDPILTQKSPGNFEPAPTASNRLRAKGNMQSPLLFLLHLLAPSEQPLAQALSGRLISLASDSRTLRRPRLELLQHCIQETTPLAATAVRQGLRAEIWIHVAELAVSALQDPSIQPKTTSTSSSLGDEYRSALAILTCGLHFSGTEVLSVAKQLYDTLMAQASSEAGNGAPSVAVTEPLAESVVAAGSNLGIDPTTIMCFATLALTQMNPPKDRRSIDSARKALGAGPQKPTVFDPHDHLYKMIVSQLQFAYKNLDQLHIQFVIDFVSSLAALLKRWPSSSIAMMLRKIQTGIAVWVEDRDKKVEGEGEDSKAGKQAVDNFWAVVMTAVMQAPRKDTMLLRALEDLIASGLNSRQRRVVNRTIETWNRTFGKETALEYPPQVEKALRRLRPHLGVELRLPDFPSGPADEDLGPAPAFEESQESGKFIRARSRLPAPPARPRPSNDGIQSRGVKLVPGAKLRHQDSQIDYAPVDSSQAQDVSVDSQLLTEHQKEVREKQHGSTAGMFLDINSSPANVPKRSLSEKFKENNLSSDLPTEGDGNLLSTPVHPKVNSDGLNDLGGSSPTPMFRKDRWELMLAQNYITSSAADRFFETEIPSSPPLATKYVSLPPDSSFAKESLLEQSQKNATCRPSPGLSQDSPISIPSHSSDSWDDDDAARQLADESQARTSFRGNKEPAAMKSDPIVENTLLEVEGFNGKIEASLNGLDSFSDVSDDLPQGTAEPAKDKIPSRILVDDGVEQEDDEVFSTPTGVRSQSPAQAIHDTQLAQTQDDSVVEDSFTRLDVKRDSPDRVDTTRHGQSRPEGPSSTNKSQRKRAKKRKNQAIDSEGPTKRVKTSQSQEGEESSQVSITSGHGKMDQVNSTIGEETKAPTTDNTQSSSSSAKAPRSLQPEFRYKRSNPPPSETGTQSSLAPLTSESRVSPRLSGQTPHAPLSPFRKRKSRLSASQTVEDDQDMDHEETNYGDTTIDLDVIHETPAVKKRKGRPPKRPSDGSETSQSTVSSQATPNASGTGPTRGRGRPRKNSLEASGSQSQRQHERSDDPGSIAAAEARSTRQSKQQSGSADTGNGGTAETETGRSRAESQHDATAASQASQASDGRRKKEPRSILARLKQLLADAKSMVVGRDEERECCDVMFELQREVHEAARRGEAQGQ